MILTKDILRRDLTFFDVAEALPDDWNVGVIGLLSTSQLVPQDLRRIYVKYVNPSRQQQLQILMRLQKAYVHGSDEWPKAGQIMHLLSRVQPGLDEPSTVEDFLAIVRGAGRSNSIEDIFTNLVPQVPQSILISELLNYHKH